MDSTQADLDRDLRKSIFDSMHDVTGQLRATAYINQMYAEGRIGDSENAAIMFGNPYHSCDLETLNARWATNNDMPVSTGTEVIDPDHGGQGVYAIDEDSGLINALENWWGVKPADPGTRLKELTEKWRTSPAEHYEHPGHVYLPSAATSAINEVTGFTDFLIAVDDTYSLAERIILGLDINDRTGMDDFLKSLTDPSITRETHIKQELQRQQERKREHHQSH